MTKNETVCVCAFGTIDFRDANGQIRAAMLVHSCAEHREKRRKTRAYLHRAFAPMRLMLPAPMPAEAC